MKRDHWILHLLGVWALAVAHPVLDVLGRGPEFFVAHRAEPLDVLALVTVLLLVLPLGLAAVVALVALAGAGLRRPATAVAIGALTALLAAQAAQRGGLDTWMAAAAVGAAAGVASALLYARLAAVRSFFTLLGAAVAIVPLVFVSRPGMTALVTPHRSAFSSIDGATPGLRPAPVVLLVFDEFPLLSLLDGERRIDPGRFPHLSRLARDGIWFRNATTVSDYTRWALPAIVTGRRPRSGEIPTASQHPETLFTLLGRSHRLEVLEPVTALCPRRLCGSTDGGFAERAAALASDLRVVAAYVFLTPDLHERLRLPDLGANWAKFDAQRSPVPDGARGWQREVDAGFREDRRRIITDFLHLIDPDDPQPTFYFLHALLPHQPWSLLPTGQRNAAPAPLLSPMRAVARDDEWEIIQNQQRHLLQVGYVDRAVGEVVARLKAAGVYERTLLLVTADHGVSITRGQPVRSFNAGNAAEIMRVPFIVKLPSGVSTASIPTQVNTAGQRVSDRNVETIDVAPTIAHALGVRLPWPSDGTSAIDASVAPRSEKHIAYASATRDRRFDAKGPDFSALLSRRDEIFGDGDPYWTPRPPRFGEIVGRRVSELRVTESDLTADLRYPWMYERFDPQAPDVPFEVSGQLHGRPADSPPVYVAIAINGVVQAVTRTWTSQRDIWLGTPPLDAWQPGRNEISLFVVDESADGPSLARIGQRTSRPDDLNLISGAAAQFWNVRQRGFYRHQGRSPNVFRWARPEASLTVPPSDRAPTGLRVKIVRTAEPKAVLRIDVNGCTLFDGPVPRRHWATVLPLDRCRLGTEALTITLTTRLTGTQPGKGSRHRGVAVSHIMLDTAGPGQSRP